MAGVSRLQYTTEIRMIRVMCSGRVDLEFVLRALSNGMDGVFIGGCRLNECNYITHGNYDALSMVLLCKKIMEHIGLNPERLRLEFMSSGEGILFTQAVDDFVKRVKELGPLDQGEGLRLNLEAATKLVPYIKLVEREKLRVPNRSEEAYTEFYNSAELDRVFSELILDKLAISQITALLRERPLSTGEIAEALGLNPSQVSKHIKSSSRQGLVRYDEGQKCYALA
ncbi:MAG: hydrogenase iron-sulfur subunit [Aestuariibacter sp.]|nr:hydrogenase iron-sulfur subunit [Aestuariibacter sp.]